MDIELTLAAIEQDREAAFQQLARERDAREATVGAVAAERALSTSHVLSRTGRALARLLMHRIPSAARRRAV